MPLRDHARQIKAAQDLETELRELMRLSLAGDARAYASLLERIAMVLRARLMRSGNSARMSREQVEDLVQDVLMAIHQKRHTYREDLPLLPWIHTIARYRLIDAIRAQGRKPLISELDESNEAFASEAPSPSEKMDVETLLETLPEKQREVLRLAKLEELPLAEVGQRMNMSLSAVKVTIHRALATLRRNNDSKPEGDYENE